MQGVDHGVQNGLAGNLGDEVQGDHLAQDVASLVSCTAPITGDYREAGYRALVDEAVDRLKDKLFSRAPGNQNALGVAVCCKSWGEVRTLITCGHPPHLIHRFDNRKPQNKLTRSNFKAKVLGNSPDDWTNEPWEVHLPKYRVRCTHAADRKYKVRVEVGGGSSAQPSCP